MEKVSNILSYFREELSAVADEREITSWYYISIEYLWHSDISAKTQ